MFLDFEKRNKDILSSIKEWGFLRVYFRPFFKKESFTTNKKDFLKIFKSLFFGIKNYFNKYDYLFFSDSKERRLVNGKWIDKYADDIIDRLNGKTLLFELPVPLHYKNVKTRYIVSESLIYFFAKFVSFFIKGYKIEKLEKILSKENLNIEYKKFLKDFYSKYVVYKFFLKLYKPKAIFVNCYYCRIALIKAAKDLNIKVIEIQHGVIKNHDMYKSEVNVDKYYIPDILLSWGIIDEKLLIEKIFPIGSYYLEFVKKFFPVIDLRGDYKYSICVSLQDIDERINNQFFKFINSLPKDIRFLLIPRRKYIDFKFNENIEVLKDDCYKILLSSDFHMSLYSSCAIEAPALNKPNILLDIEGFASRYFKDLGFTKIISSQEEFKKAIEELKDFKEIDKDYKLIISNYEERINKFLKENL